MKTIRHISDHKVKTIEANGKVFVSSTRCNMDTAYLKGIEELAKREELSIKAKYYEAETR